MKKLMQMLINRGSWKLHQIHVMKMKGFSLPVAVIVEGIVAGQSEQNAKPRTEREEDLCRGIYPYLQYIPYHKRVANTWKRIRILVWIIMIFFQIHELKCLGNAEDNDITEHWV